MTTTNSSIQNFGGNVTLNPQAIHRPASEQDLLEILENCSGKKIRAIGKLHCWSKAIEADEVLILTDLLNSISINRSGSHCEVTVGGGCQVQGLLDELAQHGLTLPSIGLIDKQSVAGATATGTHGSGKHSLSHYIRSARIAHFDQNERAIVTTINSGAELQAARCSLGLLGIVVSLTFQCRESYRICEHAAKYHSIASVLDQEPNFPQQQFYLMPWSWQYFAHHRVETNSSRSWLAGLYRLYCFIGIDVLLHVIVYVISKILRPPLFAKIFYKWIVGMTIPRNWKVVDESREMLVMQHDLFRHIEIELFVTRSHLSNASQFVIDALTEFAGQTSSSRDESLIQLLKPQRGSYCHRYPICFRKIIPDETLISMCCPMDKGSQDDWYAISLISYEWPRHRQGFYKMADFLAGEMKRRFAARCHWGKYNPLVAADNMSLYPEMPRFNEIRATFDPKGRFSNQWLSSVFQVEDKSLQQPVSTQAELRVEE